MKPGPTLVECHCTRHLWHWVAASWGCLLGEYTGFVSITSWSLNNRYARLVAFIRNTFSMVHVVTWLCNLYKPLM